MCLLFRKNLKKLPKFFLQCIQNLTSLYYTNIPPISIIKWHYIFCKILPKKVLLHTEHKEKPVYVVRSYVEDFNFQCYGVPIYGLILYGYPFFHNTHFELENSAARCVRLKYLYQAFTNFYSRTTSTFL